MILSVGSLFSGIGGFELGLERAGGFKTAWQCEKDPFCLKVLEKHWPDVKRFTDIHEMKEDIPYVDVICGGFPCQDISCAGKGAGIHAERSGLWWEMLRVIRLVRPRYILVENVAALLNRGLDEVLGSLAKCGYDAEWNIVSAASVGAPHLRKRVFVVAHALSLDPQRRGEAGNVACPRRKAEGEAQERQRGGDASFDSSPIISDTKSIRCGGGQMLSEASWERWGICAEGDNPWSIEPDVGRVANGVPSRVDRLRALGNAIVPQCAEFVGRCLLDSIHEVPA